MKMFKRLVLFVSLLFVYLIVREMLHFYLLADSVNPYFGYTVLFLIIAILIYFVIIPVFRISRLSGDPGPVRRRNKELDLIGMRLQRALKNPYLKSVKFEHPKMGSAIERYELTTQQLSIKADEIRRKYIVHLFYSTAVSQYGFIDAILIFSANVNLVKEIFTLYTGRATGRDLWQIMKQIYYSIAIGGSEGVEFATEELISKLGSDSMRSIPFFEKVMVSVAGGFSNAVLLSRVSLITENYCKLSYIESTKDLSPDPAQVLKATRAIVDEPIIYIKKQLNDIAKQKALDFSKYAINPTRTVIEKALEKFTADQGNEDKEKRSILRSIAVGVNPMNYFSHRSTKPSKIRSLFKRSVKSL